MMIALFAASIVFCLTMLFAGLLLPFISMIECAVSKHHSGFKKFLWIVSFLVFGALSSFAYGFFSTRSNMLRRVSLKTLVVLLLSGGALAFLGSSDPAFRKAFMDRLEAERTSGFGNSVDFGFADLDASQGEAASEIDWTNASFEGASGDPDLGIQNVIFRSHAMSALLRKQFDEAQGYIDKALDDDPDSVENRIVQAAIHQESGQHDAAAEAWSGLIAELTGRIALGPRTADLYSKRAQCFEQRQEYDAAIADIQQAIELEPNNETYQQALRILEIQQKFEGEDKEQPESILRLEVSESKNAASSGKSKPLPPPAAPYQKNLRENPFVK